MLTILILTHNRKHKLLKCLKSIYEIYGKHILENNIKIVVADNSSPSYDNIINEIDCYDKITYFDLRKFSGNIGYSYKYAVNKIFTKYLLLVEDDDLLTNHKFHLDVFSKLSTYKNTIISFQYRSIEQNSIKTYMNFPDNIEININNIPEIWNGEFKFDCCYYPVDSFKYALNFWLKNDIHMFDGSSDEAIYLLMLKFGTQIKHFNKCGLFVTSDQLNESSNNPYMVIYSSRSYISELGKIFNLPLQWVEKYQKIQLNVINKMIQRQLTYNDVYSNPKIMLIASNVDKMLKNGCKFSTIKTFIFNEMRKTLC